MFRSNPEETCRVRRLIAVICVWALAGCGSPSGLEIGEERVAANEAEVETQMRTLIEEISLARQAENDTGLMTRFNQVKTVACTEARFTVPALEPRLAQGLFASAGEYPATLRFANATELDDTKKDLRGLSIKVEGVAGAEGPDGTRGVQDFLFNSYPALFVGTPDIFLDFIQATADGSRIGFFLRHPKSLLIVLRARDNPSSPLAISYYSTTPFRHGDTSAVKYAVSPCDAPPDAQGEGDNPNYLRAALARDLNTGEACFDFKVQFQTNPDLMPLEDASVVWPEHASPYESVARITIATQDIADPAALAACERLTFNPWNTLPAHRPLGGINRVRKGLYEDIGRFRNSANAGT